MCRNEPSLGSTLEASLVCILGVVMRVILSEDAYLMPQSVIVPFAEL